MRSALATVVACLFVVMTTADLLACPDGCTDEPPAQTVSQHAPSPCALCHGWNHTPIIVASRPVALVIGRLFLNTPSPAPPELPAIEPPPKSA